MFRTIRHRLARISQTKTEIAGRVNILTYIRKENAQREDIKLISLLLMNIRKHPRSGLTYVSLDKGRTK